MKVLGLNGLETYPRQMDLGIRGKVAMVAAGTKGIGLACARAFADEGCLVSVCGRNEPEIPLGKGIRYYQCDVSVASDLAKWFAETKSKYGAPSVVVTNTGGPPAGSWTEMSDEQWQSGVDSTLMNVVRMVRLCVPDMGANNWGRIVHVTSLVAKEPNKLLPISSTLRAGLRALTRLQAVELAPNGITVNSVLPGHTLTDRQRHLAGVRAEREGIAVDEALRLQGESVPTGRLARPEEIAAAVVFLCSEPASYINGVNLLVDGGLTRGLA